MYYGFWSDFLYIVDKANKHVDITRNQTFSVEKKNTNIKSKKKIW